MVGGAPRQQRYGNSGNVPGIPWESPGAFPREFPGNPFKISGVHGFPGSSRKYSLGIPGIPRTFPGNSLDFLVPENRIPGIPGIPWKFPGNSLDSQAAPESGNASLEILLEIVQANQFPSGVRSQLVARLVSGPDLSRVGHRQEV